MQQGKEKRSMGIKGNKSPFLSIIVPAYNVEQYLKQCVDSILTQEFRDYELLLVDDGSTDQTGQICDDYAGIDERIRVIHKKNGGLVSARKAGIREAKGTYVGYVDGDDWIASDMYGKLCQKAKEEDADIVICDFFSAYEEENIPITQNMMAGVYEGEKLEKEVYPVMLCKGEYFDFGFYPALWCKIFKTEIFGEHQLSVEEKIKMGEDAACFYETMLDAGKIVYLKQEYCYYYRMRATSISHSMINSFYTNEIFLLLTHMEQGFLKRTESSKILLGQLYRYACYMFDNMLTPHLCFRELFCKKKLLKEMATIADHPVGKKMIEYGRKNRTSSRMKRILKVIDNRKFANRLELYLFVMYEKMATHKKEKSKRKNRL